MDFTNIIPKVACKRCYGLWLVLNAITTSMVPEMDFTNRAREGPLLVLFPYKTPIFSNLSSKGYRIWLVPKDRLFFSFLFDFLFSFFSGFSIVQPFVLRRSNVRTFLVRFLFVVRFS